jgi:hypothetical protein
LPGFRFPGRFGFRRTPREDRPRRRRFNPLWALLWLVVLIIVLGLLFGGYRKGSPVKNPGSWVTVGSAATVGRAYPPALPR